MDDTFNGLLDTNTLATRGEVQLHPDTLDWSRCRPVRMPDGTLSAIKDHVKVGVRALVANPYFLLADEMGGMKSAQVILAAQFLYEQGLINRVLVLAPASVRPKVWYDKELGELGKHLWDNLPVRVSEFHSKIRQWDSGDWSQSIDQLRWIVTNYEFVGRSKARVKQMLAYCGPRTLLILDESSYVRTKTSLQSKAALALRKACGRVVELNGTPVSETPMDLMNQCNILHPSILACPYITQFRERYCVLAPHVDFPLVLGWKNLDDIQRRLAPYVLRRLKKDCLDLPAKLPPVVITATLNKSWPPYKSMKNDMVAWLNSRDASIAQHAGTKAMRLLQLTSGFVGGVETVLEDDGEPYVDDPSRPSFVADSGTRVAHTPRVGNVQEVGREKLDVVLAFFKEHHETEHNFKLLVWCQFIPELERMMREVTRLWPAVTTGMLRGGQRRADREHVLRLLDPFTSPDAPIFVGATSGTGAVGHNFTAVHTVINCSYSASLHISEQSDDRFHRPGQIYPVSYFDIVAVGPAGQKTIDEGTLKARRNKKDTATWMQSAWLDILSET